MNKNYELKPMFDARKSFYKKARVSIIGDVKILTSYNTEVAKIKNGKIEVYGTYSNTTLRHIKEFLLQNNFVATSKSQIEKDYIKS